MIASFRLPDDIVPADSAVKAYGHTSLARATASTQMVIDTYPVAQTIPTVTRYPEGERIMPCKGSPRPFGPGSPGLLKIYRGTVQSVICGRAMEPGFYQLVGAKQAMPQPFRFTVPGFGQTLVRAGRGQATGPRRAGAASDGAARHHPESRVDEWAGVGSGIRVQEHLRRCGTRKSARHLEKSHGTSAQ